MRTETEMIAYALEVDPQLLPWMPEILADFDALGSDANAIVQVLRMLDLPPSVRVVDLGCGKGAVAVAIARAIGCAVEGIELFAPFVEACRDRAIAAGVSGLCRFRHADILKVAGRIQPADVAIHAALGDVLGPPDDTVGVVRRFVRPGGLILVSDGYVKDGGSADFPGFGAVGSRTDMQQRLQAHGDVLKHEVVQQADCTDAYGRELAQIRARVERLAAHRPDLADALMRYLDNQAREYAYLAANINPAIWVLQRGDGVPTDDRV